SNGTNESSQNEEMNSEMVFTHVITPITTQCNNFNKEAMFHVLDYHPSYDKNLTNANQVYDSQEFENSGSKLMDADISYDTKGDGGEEEERNNQEEDPQITSSPIRKNVVHCKNRIDLNGIRSTTTHIDNE
ncbi:18123_t:CDS:2, partial [Acaulospora morrowiae]